MKEVKEAAAGVALAASWLARLAGTPMRISATPNLPAAARSGVATTAAATVAAIGGCRMVFVAVGSGSVAISEGQGLMAPEHVTTTTTNMPMG